LDHRRCHGHLAVGAVGSTYVLQKGVEGAASSLFKFRLNGDFGHEVSWVFAQFETGVGVHHSVGLLFSHLARLSNDLSQGLFASLLNSIGLAHTVQCKS
jgi:hypothetical protein